MIELAISNGKIKATGSFDIGYIGKYDGDIIDTDPLDEVREWDIVQEHFDSEFLDEEMLKFLTDYYNNYEKRIQDNIKKINGQFLVCMMHDLASCEYPFWETEELIANKSCLDTAYSKHADAAHGLFSKYGWNETPNDESVHKEWLEDNIRFLYSAFNFDALIKSIVPENLHLSDGYVAFQCSDGFDGVVLRNAYGEFDSKLTITDWHNF